MIALFEDINSRNDLTELIVGSMDLKAFYPSLLPDETATALLRKRETCMEEVVCRRRKKTMREKNLCYNCESDLNIFMLARLHGHLIPNETSTT